MRSDWGTDIWECAINAFGSLSACPACSRATIHTRSCRHAKAGAHQACARGSFLAWFHPWRRCKEAQPRGPLPLIQLLSHPAGAARLHRLPPGFVPGFVHRCGRWERCGHQGHAAVVPARPHKGRCRHYAVHSDGWADGRGAARRSAGAAAAAVGRGTLQACGAAPRRRWRTRHPRATALPRAIS